MSTVINTNLASLFAQNSLSNAQNNLAVSVQRLSSGLRINSAKDDAAGLAISQNMQSQINGTNQSIQNLNDATNLLQTADSSLATVQDMLLRMKQLSVQGYDGSLSNTQKADIVQQMTQLNSEINATAQRTSFNGVNLLSSGSSIDNTNSDIRNNVVLTPTGAGSAVALDTTAGTVGALTNLSDTANFLDGSGNAPGTAQPTATTISIMPNPVDSLTLPGTYKVYSKGDQLTITGTVAGVPTSQTITVNEMKGLQAAGTNNPQSQTMNFDKFGIEIQVSNNVAAGLTETGALIAKAIAAPTTLVFTGKSSVVENLATSGAAPGTYQLTQGDTITSLSSSALNTFIGAGGAATGMTTPPAQNTYYTVGLTGATSGATGAQASILVDSAGKIQSMTLLSGGSGYSAAGEDLTIAAGAIGPGSNALTITGGLASGATAAQVTMSGTVNGKLTSQSVQVSTGTANTKQSMNFDTFGLSFDVHSYQTMTGDEIATALVNTTSGSNGTPGQVVVSQGVNSQLQFQSGASSSAFISINTLNIQTANSGSQVGNNAAMMGVGSSIDALLALSAKGSLGSQADWAAAFQTAAAAMDTATDQVSTERSIFGSQMNRLSYVSTNLQAQSTNLQNSRSAIIDTNFASETASLTKGQIMQQAATAMLAQANQMPNVILSLLK